MAIGFDPDAYVAGLSEAERRNMQLYGANLATYEERKAVGDALRRAAAANAPPPRATNGMIEGQPVTEWTGIYDDGSSNPGYGGTPARGVNEIPMPQGAAPPLSGGPGVQDPTAPGVIDWGGENIPSSPTTMPIEPTMPPTPNPSTTPQWNTGTKGGGGGYSGGPVEWDWEGIGERTDTGGFGQYFQGYDASERYIPGQDAWWGSEDTPGDNRDFYQNQLANLLRQDQNYREGVREAAISYEEAQDQEPLPLDWSWVEGGLPEVRQGGDPTAWKMNEAVSSGMTNQEILDALSPNLQQSTVDFYTDTWSKNPDLNAGGQNWWAEQANPDALNVHGNAAGQAAAADLGANLFIGNNAPGIPKGYAAPTAGWQQSENTGYQQGGAAYYYDPVSKTTKTIGPTGGGVTFQPGSTV